MNTYPTFEGIRIMSGPYQGNIYTALDLETGGCFHVRITGLPDAPKYELCYQELYADVGGFYYGFALVQNGGRWHFIKPDGGLAYNKTFSVTVSPFDEKTGSALVCTPTERFYLHADTPGGTIAEISADQLVPIN